MDYMVFLSLLFSIIISSSSCYSTATTTIKSIPLKPVTTPATIMKTLTTTGKSVKEKTSKSSNIFDIISSTTTPLPRQSVDSFRDGNSSKSINNQSRKFTKQSNETKEILSGQEQAQSPFIRGRGRPNGFQPTLGPNVTPNYNPNYGVPFNSFLPQGIPFGGSPSGSPNGLNNNLRPGGGYGIGGPQGQLGNNQQGQGQLSSPLDLLSGFIPTPGPGGSPYTGTPTPFGQPVTGYPGYPNYPGVNPNYGPVNTPGLANGLNNLNGQNIGFGARRGGGNNVNGYNQLGGGIGSPDVAGLGINPGYNDGQVGGLGGGGGGGEGPVGGESGEDEGVNDNGSNEETNDGTGEGDGEGASGNNENGQDESVQPDYGGTGNEGGDTGAEDGTADNGAGNGGESGGDPANDPDLASFQNFQNSNFPGDLFPPGILSQQDLNDIQKSIEEQQKKEAEKNKKQEESSAQPDYDYDNNSGGNADEDQPSTETPVNKNLQKYNNNQPVVPNYQNNRYNQQQQQPVTSNGNRGAYANNNRRLPQANKYNNNNNQRKQVDQQYVNNNQRKPNRYDQPTRNNQENQFDDNIGYNANNNVGDTGGKDYDYNDNGSGESGLNQNQDSRRLRGDSPPSPTPRYNRYRNGAYSSPDESTDYDSNGEQPSRYSKGQTTPSYPRGSNLNRFNDQSGRYRPGSFGRSGYRGEDLKDFGGHSANSDHQNDVEPGVDYTPDPIYDSKQNTRKQDNHHRSHNNHNWQIAGQMNNLNNRNRFNGVKPSVDYDGETRNYQGSTRRPRLVSNQYDLPLQSTINNNNNHRSSSTLGYIDNPLISNRKKKANQFKGYDSSEVDYIGGKEDDNNQAIKSMGNMRNHNQGNYVNLSQSDYNQDGNDSSSDSNDSNYHETPRFVASEKKEAKSSSTINKKQNDPFLRG